MYLPAQKEYKLENGINLVSCFLFYALSSFFMWTIGCIRYLGEISSPIKFLVFPIFVYGYILSNERNLFNIIVCLFLLKVNIIDFFAMTKQLFKKCTL